MTTTLIRYPQYYQTRPVGTQKVYLKQRWEDDWEETAWLQCTSATWAAAPSMPTAELSYDYGRGMRPDKSMFENVERLTDRQRWYVKIEFDVKNAETKEEGGIDPETGDPTDFVEVTDPLLWYGVLQIDANRQSGIYFDPPVNGTLGTWKPRGMQQLVCYGLEHILERTQIATSVWDNDGSLVTIDRGLTFNLDGQPNRSLNFTGFSYVFSRRNQEFWSTRQAVQYLMDNAAPRDETGLKKIPFQLDADTEAILPDGDQINLATEGQSLRNVLNRLMPRQRLLSWTLEVNEPGLTISLRPISLTSSAVDEIPASTDIKKILSDEASDAVDVLKESTELAVDQVLIRGARRTSTASYSFDDNTLVERWGEAEKAKYDEGASNAGDYPPAARRDERRRRDADARSRPDVEAVYAFFGPPEDWDGLVGNGTGGAKKPASPKDDDADAVYPNLPRETAFTQRLSLRQNFDYLSSLPDPPEKAPEPHDRMPPQVFFLMPDYQVDRWVRGDKIARAAQSPITRFSPEANRTFSVRAAVLPNEFTFQLNVNGAEQHAIAKDDFVPLAHDKQTGSVSFRKMVATLTFEDSRWCEGKWPETLTETVDAVQRRIIYAGDAYRQDYVAPQTVLDIDEYGELQRVAAPGFIQDDSGVLNNAAQIAHAYYGRTRRALELAVRATAGLRIGDMIASIGDEARGVNREVNTAVSQMRITWPKARSEQGTGELTTTAPRLAVSTDFAQLDALQFITSTALVTIPA